MFAQNAFEEIIDARVPAGLGGRWYGCYAALVSDIKDPDGQGRVKVTLPWSPDTANGRYEAWARLAQAQALYYQNVLPSPETDNGARLAMERATALAPEGLLELNERPAGKVRRGADR